MKTLLLLRHAKSSWKDASLIDFDRPLNERGKRAAPLMGRYARRQKIGPDLLLSSPAERTRQTAALFAQAASISAPLRFDERIYEASAERLLEVVSQTESEVRELLLVGHNPGLEELLFLLTGQAHLMPTAALVSISLNIEDWSSLRERTGQLSWLVKPKELPKD